MGFYLQVEFESSLSPAEFHERVVVPLQERLAEESIGELLDDAIDDEERAEGCYEFCLKVTDQKRASEIVEEIAGSYDQS